MSRTSGAAGGAWLLEPADAHTVLTPERLPEEHRMIARTAREFARRDIMPALPAMDAHDWAAARRVLRRAGELGLIGADVPDAYGGAGMGTAAALVVSSALAGNASFSALFGAQANLTIGAILHFGSEHQKARYLPRLTTGELVGAYALSESGSGSDALSASTRATRQPDGTFALNGEKMWTTNGGFADVFIVFAKVDGQHFTAFIVERSYSGVSTGNEEHKMGLHGSSTTPLVLREAVIPAENVLGGIGTGHKVAFSVLNLGRLKLGAMCVGTAHAVIGESARYAATRCQFGKPLSAFGAIRHKIGEMTARTYAVESLLFRVAGLLDDARLEGEPSDGVLSRLEEMAIEASVAKITGSEMLDFVVDENVQIHGGNGFVREYAAERHFRDARVNRIFEGTNEINRLVVASMLLRRASGTDLPFLSEARRQRDRLLEGSLTRQTGVQNPMHQLATAVAGLKASALAILALAHDHYGADLANEQEILIDIADLVVAAGCADSAWLRASVASGEPPSLHYAAAAVSISVFCHRAEASVRHAASAMLTGDALYACWFGVAQLLAPATLDTVSSRRRLADESVRLGRYIFQ